MPFKLYAILVVFQLFSIPGISQLPELPPGNESVWVLERPRQLVQFFAFDTVAFSNYLPDSLRYMTLGELAAAGHSQSRQILSENTGFESMGVLFIEIVQYRSRVNGFTPENGEIATGLVAAGVTPRSRGGQYLPGQLMIGSWSPDDLYVNHLNDAGHLRYAGNAEYTKESGELIRATLHTDHFQVTMTCLPDSVQQALPPGEQFFYYPPDFHPDKVLVVAFKGHQRNECVTHTSDIQGESPMRDLIPIGPVEHQSDYVLQGGVYDLKRFLEFLKQEEGR